jgi:AraC-like DNA-binding protein
LFAWIKIHQGSFCYLVGLPKKAAKALACYHTFAFCRIHFSKSASLSSRYTQAKLLAIFFRIEFNNLTYFTTINALKQLIFLTLMVNLNFKLMLDVISLLYLISASQMFLLAAMLAVKPQNRFVNSPLTVFLLLTGLECLFLFFYQTPLIFSFPFLLYKTEAFNMLSGVLIFVYCRNIYFNKFYWRKIDFLFFLPFLLYFIYYQYPFSESDAEKLRQYRDFLKAGQFSSENLWEWTAEIAAVLPFLWFSFPYIKKYHGELKNNLSDIKNYQIFTTEKTLYFALALYSFEILLVILYFFEIQFTPVLHHFLYIFLIFGTYFLAYNALIRNDLNEKMKPRDNFILPENLISENQINEEINPQEDSPLPENKQNNPPPKYAHLQIGEEKMNEIAQKIVVKMQHERLFLNPELRLSELADSLQISHHYVSMVINEKFNQSFFDYINSFRVDEAKRLLCDKKYSHFTITAVGFEAGFNSKSAFYSAFKKFTQKTPLEYQKSN